MPVKQKYRTYFTCPKCHNKWEVEEIGIPKQNKCPNKKCEALCEPVFNEEIDQ